MKNEPNNYIPRILTRPERSFFLFGPRGTGKSTMLRQVLPEALHLDLLDASLYLELSREPHRLEAIIGNRPKGPGSCSMKSRRRLPCWMKCIG